MRKTQTFLRSVDHVHVCTMYRTFDPHQINHPYHQEPISAANASRHLWAPGIMDAQQRKEARLSRRRERERRNRTLESAEEREARLARQRVRDRALRAAQSTARREEALQRRRERGEDGS